MALADPAKEIPRLTSSRWHFIEELGRGGQGTVYKVRNREANRLRARLQGEIADAVRNMSAVGDVSQWPVKLAEALNTYLQGDSPSSLGALKVLHPLGQDSEEVQQAVRRFEMEVEALRRIEHPGVLRLRDADVPAHWMVTELHRGSLANCLDRYKGKALDALMAFRPLVEAAAKIHETGAVHRDIKPPNIFMATDDHLVLGDFGIVFFEEGHDRLTQTFERVGTRDWMAPWANTGMRIDEVKPTFDVFPLGKVLWCMVSGQRLLPYWYHTKPQHDLTRLFPTDPHMRLLNDLLDRCIVETEDACLPSATDLLQLVDEKIGMMGRGGQVLRLDTPRPCVVCGRGQYLPWPPDGQQSIERVLVAVPKTTVVPAPIPETRQPYFHMGSMAFSIRLFACTECGHTQLFWWPDAQRPPAWQIPSS